jgi:hypothetical protein
MRKWTHDLSPVGPALDTQPELEPDASRPGEWPAVAAQRVQAAAVLFFVEFAVGESLSENLLRRGLDRLALGLLGRSAQVADQSDDAPNDQSSEDDHARGHEQVPHHCIPSPSQYIILISLLHEGPNA